MNSYRMFSLLLKTRAFPLKLIETSGIKSSLLSRVRPMPTRPTMALNNVQAIRTIFSSYALGIDGFLSQGEDLRYEITQVEKVEDFISRMESFVQSKNKDEMILSEDIKKVIAVCQKEEKYIHFAIDLIKQYRAQIEELNFQPFLFGPQIMRLFHINGCTDLAFKALRDDDLKAIFDQPTSYQLAMDRLYKDGHYDDVAVLMDDIVSKDHPVPNTCMLLALAANYKKGTHESLEKSMSLMKLVKSKQSIGLRSIVFVAGLALNLQEYEKAIEIVMTWPAQSHFLLNNIYVLSQGYLGNFAIVNENLRKRIMITTANSGDFERKQVFSYDTIERLQALMFKCLNEETLNRFIDLKENLKSNNLISERTLDESICLPIARAAGGKPKFTSRRPQI